MYGHIDNLNKELKRISSEQKELSTKIEGYNDEKEDCVNDYAKEITFDMEKEIEAVDTIRDVTECENNSISQLNSHFMELYFEAFSRIVNKRIETKYRHKALNRHYYSDQSPKVWINNRGLAVKHRWGTITNTLEDYDDIIEVLKDCDLSEYIGKTKQDIYEAIYECAKDWILIPKEWKQFYVTNAGKYSYIKTDDDRDYGISSISIDTKKYIQLNWCQTGLTLSMSNEKKSTGYYWGSKSYYLTAEKEQVERRNNYYRDKEDAGLSGRALFALSQLDDEGRDELRRVSKIFENAQKVNLDLLSKMSNKLTPYLVIKAL